MTVEIPGYIEIAADKIKTELNIDVYKLAERLGKNDNFCSWWISVEDNQESTEEEMKTLSATR